MVSLLGTVAAAVVALTLLAAATAHTRHPARLTTALREHARHPAPAPAGPIGNVGHARPIGDLGATGRGGPVSRFGSVAGAVAVLVTVVEAVIGAAVLGGLVGVLPAGPGLVAATVLFTGYAGYTEYLRRTRPAVPCGCGLGNDVMVDGWVVGRAAALAALALLGATAPGTTAAGVEGLVAACAAGALAVLLWQLPAAMHDPEGALR